MDAVFDKFGKTLMPNEYTCTLRFRIDPGRLGQPWPDLCKLRVVTETRLRFICNLECGGPVADRNVAFDRWNRNFLKPDSTLSRPKYQKEPAPIAPARTAVTT